jgi:hypothetical protein
MACAGAVLRQTKFSVVTTIDHMQNFFECIKSRKDPNAAVETGSGSGPRRADGQSGVPAQR